MSGKNVMLNLFQHLDKTKTYETLNQVQGDKKHLCCWYKIPWTKVWALFFFGTLPFIISLQNLSGE